MRQCKICKRFTILSHYHISLFSQNFFNLRCLTRRRANVPLCFKNLSIRRHITLRTSLLSASNFVIQSQRFLQDCFYRFQKPPYSRPTKFWIIIFGSHYNVVFFLIQISHFYPLSTVSHRITIYVVRNIPPLESNPTQRSRY